LTIVEQLKVGCSEPENRAPILMNRDIHDHRISAAAKDCPLRG
jgi:hypothetical protein